MFIFVALVSFVSPIFAQWDDVYYTPQKRQNKTVVSTKSEAQQTQAEANYSDMGYYEKQIREGNVSRGIELLVEEPNLSNLPDGIYDVEVDGYGIRSLYGEFDMVTNIYNLKNGRYTLYVDNSALTFKEIPMQTYYYDYWSVSSNHYLNYWGRPHWLYWGWEDVRGWYGYWDYNSWRYFYGYYWSSPWGYYGGDGPWAYGWVYDRYGGYYRWNYWGFASGLNYRYNIAARNGTPHSTRYSNASRSTNRSLLASRINSDMSRRSTETASVRGSSSSFRSGNSRSATVNRGGYTRDSYGVGTRSSSTRGRDAGTSSRINSGSDRRSQSSSVDTRSSSSSRSSSSVGTRSSSSSSSRSSGSIRSGSSSSSHSFGGGSSSSSRGSSSSSSSSRSRR